MRAQKDKLSEDIHKMVNKILKDSLEDIEAGLHQTRNLESILHDRL